METKLKMVFVNVFQTESASQNTNHKLNEKIILGS